MAKDISTRTTRNNDLGSLMNRLYDVIALIECAADNLDDDKNGNAIRTIRHAQKVAQKVINSMDRIQFAEFVRTHGAVAQ